MAEKKNALPILGVLGATVLAAGGSAFLTNTALSLTVGSTEAVYSTEAQSEMETELPITVESFAKTADSFTVAKKSASTTNRDSRTERETNADGSVVTDGDNTSAENGSSADGSSYTENGSDGYTSDGSNGTDGSYTSDGTSTDGGSTSGGTGRNPATYYDGSGGESEGYHTDAEGVTYYADGNGNLYYPDSRGNYYWAAGPGSAPAEVNIPAYSNSGSSNGGSSNGGSSNGGSDNGGSSNGGGSYNNGSATDDSYLMYDINSRYISADEISGWSSYNLAALRNEIYARHGRMFTTPEWSSYFANKTWYVPTYSADYFDANVGSFFNDYEWANLEVILKVEEQR